MTTPATTTATVTALKPEQWTELRGKIKSKWSKFGDADLDSFKENMDLISQKIHMVYGTAKDKAELEYKDFKKSIEEKPKA